MVNYLRIGGGIGGARPRVQIEIVQLTPEMIAAKRVEVPIAINNDTILLINNFAKQNLGIDYELSGRIISWAGKSLDGFLEAGEFFYLYY
jgi:hypothetical protein